MAILILFAVCPALASANDLKQIDRSIGKEPAYKGKPKYCLLVFDRAGKERVWIVQDGDTLYVDRQGNGDLTDPKNKVAAKKRELETDDDRFVFDVDELSVGGRIHQNLRIGLYSINHRDPDPDDYPQPRVSILDLSGKTPPRVLIAPTHGYVGSVVFSPDGRTLALGCAGAVHLFDMTK
jgi:hypothetical protein